MFHTNNDGSGSVRSNNQCSGSVTLISKGKDLEPDPDKVPHILQTNPDADSGGLKTCGYYGS